MKKESFVLYTNYDIHIASLTDAQKGKLFTAIFKHVKREPVDLEALDAEVRIAFSFISAQIDRDIAKYESVSEKRRLAGAKGGAPKGNKNACKDYAKNKQNQTKQPDNDTEPDTDTDTDNDNDTEPDTDTGIGTDTDNDSDIEYCFTPPSVDDISDYCMENNYNVDPNTFYDYYSANGWNVGPNKMKDWKAEVRLWAKRDCNRSNTSSNKTNIVPDNFFIRKMEENQ